MFPLALPVQYFMEKSNNLKGEAPPLESRIIVLEEVSLNGEMCPKEVYFKHLYCQLNGKALFSMVEYHSLQESSLRLKCMTK